MIQHKLLSIEGLRGILAVLVCVGHFGLNTVTNKLGLHVNFGLAVDVFFALSGFVLTQSYYLGRRSFIDLLRGRVARLYPLHALTLLWVLLLFWQQSQPIDWSIVAQSMLLLQNIGLPPQEWDFNVPSWSISVEMVMSLVFYSVIRRKYKFDWIVLAVCASATYALMGLKNLESNENYFSVLNVGLVRGAAGFAMGAASRLVVARYGFPVPLVRRSEPVLMGLLLALFFVRVPTPWFYLAFAVTSLFAVTATVLNDRGSMLSFGPLVFLGKISYSVYLLHIPVLYTATAIFGAEAVRGLVAKMTMLVIIIALSTACHRWYEIPAQRWLLARLPKGRVREVDFGVARSK